MSSIPLTSDQTITLALMLIMFSVAVMVMAGLVSWGWNKGRKGWILVVFFILLSLICSVVTMVRHGG